MQLEVLGSHLSVRESIFRLGRFPKTEPALSLVLLLKAYAAKR